MGKISDAWRQQKFAMQNLESSLDKALKEGVKTIVTPGGYVLDAEDMSVLDEMVGPPEPTGVPMPDPPPPSNA